MVPAGTLDERLIAIVGPTASGKTSVAIRVAEQLGGEIVSADSMAVYRGMDIGTAKPTTVERQQIPFHLLDAADPEEQFSVARFKELGQAAIAEILARGRVPLIVGGTGLYVRVLLEDFGLTNTPADPAIRSRLDAEAASRGAPALHRRLAEVDPAAAGRIHPNDRVRIVRALEVFERTGEPISVQQARDAAARQARQARPSIRFGLTAARDEMYRRIDARVDAMMAAGLLDEVRRLLALGLGPTSAPLRSLGYKELAAHLRGDMRLEEAVDAIKQETRRFAKRQLTWFNTDQSLIWIDMTDRSVEDAAAEIVKAVNEAAQ